MLRNGFCIQPDRSVYAIVNGSMYEVEADDKQLDELDPGYYDLDLAPVAEDDAVAKSNPNHDERGRFASGALSGGTLAEGNAGLKQYIELIANAHGADQPNVAKMLLDHGRAFQVDNKSFIGGSKAQQCYMNAAKAAWADSDLTYVEGYVSVHGVPIAHAWTTDKTGMVRDPTLGPESAKMVKGYYGVPIKTQFLTKQLLKTKTYGILTGEDSPRALRSILAADPNDVVEQA